MLTIIRKIDLFIVMKSNYTTDDSSNAWEKLRKNGRVAVLYSPGYGAGWYTWNADYEGLIFDREIVEAVLTGDIKYAKSIAAKKYPSAYLGADQLEVTWILEGQAFEINEYDGNESIHIIGECDYLIA